MPNDALSQQALANDPVFRRRVQSSLAKIAFQVLTEDPNTVGHASRATYARSVIANPVGVSGNICAWIVMRTNLFGAATSVSLVGGVPVVATAATDADMDSQLATDWSVLAGA